MSNDKKEAPHLPAGMPSRLVFRRGIALPLEQELHHSNKGNLLPRTYLFILLSPSYPLLKIYTILVKDIIFFQERYKHFKLVLFPKAIHNGLIKVQKFTFFKH